MKLGFQRFVGLAVIGGVALLIAAIYWILAATNPAPLWGPTKATLGDGITVLYNSRLPNLRLLVGALVISLLAVAAVAITERTVARRFRRTSEQMTSRPLAPKRVMARTRGVYAGPVTVTALIPAHNEEFSLPGTLQSLAEQPVPPERVIVIADNCTDRTVDVARAYGAEVYETVDNQHKKAGGLNQVLSLILPELGDNDAVLVLDADSKIGPKFLEKARALMTNDRALMAVGGLFTGELGHGLLGQFQRNEYLRYKREIRRRDGRVFVLTGTATVFRSAALAAVAEMRGSGLPGTHGEVYDTFALTEDNELTIALKSLGALMTSPPECTVETELMPTWRMLAAQRLRWQRGALENLGTYGVTPQTIRYWSQHIAIGYGVIALLSYFALLGVMAVSLDQWVWFPFWMGIGLVFAAERMLTVWQGGWSARVLALLIIPELIFDLVLNMVFLRGVAEITIGRTATWKHVDHAAAKGAEQ